MIDNTLIEGLPTDNGKAHLEAMSELRKKAARYDYVRKLNVRQFSDLFTINIVTGVAFDELVDAAITKEAK